MTGNGVKNGNGCGPSYKRLPQQVVPVNYDLTFEPDWSSHTFEATAVVDVEVREATGLIVLNSGKFTINGITYAAEGGEIVQQAEIYVLDLEAEILRINFQENLPLGLGRLTILYSGKVADNLQSLFKSKYQGANGEEKFNYLTYFEPTFARGCFPCWDEPTIKATYDITLIVPKELVALSNMPVKEDTPHPTNMDKKIVKFERSIKMSSYLMAFAIGEFDHVENVTPDGIICRVFTPVGKRDRGKFALEVVMKALAFYKSTFGIAYPLPKLDLLAVTEFPIGAMENFGLVSFRETLLLMDEELSSMRTKQHVSCVVCHETAHMWFGNLVTIEWWGDLWLKEGFASWMEYKCTDTLYPDFQIWNLFMDDYLLALELDSSATSHPIQANVEDPAEITALFDTISYNKGSSVIRMIHSYIGHEDFCQGLKLYLNKHLGGNAQTKDLWAALKEKSGKPIDVIMPTFTEQMGYPVILVKAIEQKGDQKVVTLSYEKFWADVNAKASNTVKYKWIIPLTVRTQSNPKGVALSTLIESEPGAEVQITVDSKPNEWLKLNADHVGYYRVTYPSSVLESLNTAIKQKELQPLDRLGILDDLFANVKAGHAKSDDILKFLLAYANETDHSVWMGVLKIVSKLDGLLHGSPYHNNLKSYARKLLSPVSSQLGWDAKDSESVQDALLRSSVLARLVHLGNIDTLEEARNRFGKHTRGESTVSPDLRPAVYCAVAHHGEEGFEELLKLYRSTDLLEEKMRILRSLGATNDKNLVQRLLTFGRSNEVTQQDIATILISLSDLGKQDTAWEYFCNNWEFFRDSFPSGGGIIRNIVNSITADFKSDEMAVQVEKFFQEHQFKGIERIVSQSLESIRINKAWLERDGHGLQEFLSNYA